VTGPVADYQRRLRFWRDRIAALDRVHFLVSNARLVVATALAVLLWMAVVRRTASIGWPVALGVIFGVLVLVHARFLNRLDRAHRAESLYLRGLDRLENRWIGGGRDGAAFLGAHPYARDLDLFGRGSLFELLNVARTEAGESTLARWLMSGAPLEEVRSRQAAVEELRKRPDFREDIAVLGGESEVSATGALSRWSSGPSAGLGRAASMTFAACALVTIGTVWLAFQQSLEVRWLIAWLLVEAGIAVAWRPRVRRVLAGVGVADRDLSLVSALLGRIESEPLESSRLAALKSNLFTAGVPPSRRIAQLRGLVSWLDSTRNQLFAPIAVALLLPQLLAAAIDRWHQRYGQAVVGWLRAVGEVEALSALATYAYEHPSDPFPLLIETGPLFDADGIGHPLMGDAIAVRNDVRLGGDAPRVIVLSGSNMSGKSTLLRCVGVNVVLALAGAPVRATRLRLSPLVIGATLRVDDSLQEGRSRFYAEILRIHTIVDAARGSVPLLFLLDEILHGTNSYDRRIGADAIVRALVGRGAIGLVTTHDLALTELPGELGSVAANMHFDDRLENGKIVFDYQMRAGVVEHSNALALMRAIGLEV
jgi:hypothetical protein